MAQIKVLPPEVAHKIAAGEVIERPASCVKELVENSIDAELPRSQLRFKGGLELIRVQDNGSGIARDDLELAFEPHATSKIERAEDLSPSIRSVSAGKPCLVWPALPNSLWFPDQLIKRMDIKSGRSRASGLWNPRGRRLEPQWRFGSFSTTFPHGSSS